MISYSKPNKYMNVYAYIYIYIYTVEKKMTSQPPFGGHKRSTSTLNFIK